MFVDFWGTVHMTPNARNPPQCLAVVSNQNEAQDGSAHGEQKDRIM